MTSQTYHDEAAKQEAFEEAAKFKNQYRGLDDSEAEYLESLMETKRKEEAAVKKDTLEQLDLFRKQQEEAERKALEEENNGPPATEDAQWITSGRKRKKGPEGGLLKGVKLKKAASSSDGAPDTGANAPTGSEAETASKKSSSGEVKAPAAPIRKVTVPPANPLSLSLGYGSSDEDD